MKEMNPNERLQDEARQFIQEMSEDSRARKWLMEAGGMESRWAQIVAEIQTTGTYIHSKEELAFGARLAWRNSNRCIGRHFWRSLEVRDCRSAHLDVNPEGAIENALTDHLQDAFNEGRIRSLISIFAPRKVDGSDPVRMKNHQLTRYAGFRSKDGSILGDPHSENITSSCLQAGWEPAQRTAFTALPWQFVLDGQTTPVRDVFARHPDQLFEVELTHPEREDFAHLRLRWYAVPLLADMALKIGGVVYPFAPFNGFYMGTEIGARNLSDKDRYNVLPDVAQLFGLDMNDNRSLWRDRAMVELNRAVLHSFDAAAVTIGDHHQLGAQFEAFCQAESKAGREMKGDWSWLNPPMAASQTPQFHRGFANDMVPHTNFFYQEVPEDTRNESKKENGNLKGSCPFHLP
jgi:nitric-oxide synthase